MGDAGQLALVRIGKVLDELGDRDPGNFGDLWVLVIHDAVHDSLVLGSPGRVVRKLEDNEDRWER